MNLATISKIQAASEQDTGMGFKTDPAIMRFSNKDGQEVHLKELMVRFQKAVKNGWKCHACAGIVDDRNGLMQASAPPGFEGTVLQLKKHFKNKADAFKLAWWMHEHHYKSHFTKKGKAKK